MITKLRGTNIPVSEGSPGSAWQPKLQPEFLTHWIMVLAVDGAHRRSSSSGTEVRSMCKASHSGTGIAWLFATEGGVVVEEVEVEVKVVVVVVQQ